MNFSFEHVATFIAGTATAAMAVFGLGVGVDRRSRDRDKELHDKIDDRNKTIHDKIDGRIAEVHTRVDEVKDNYVRRDDIREMQNHMDGQFEKLDEKFGSMERELKEIRGDVQRK